MIVICINGISRAGKDTFVSYVDGIAHEYKINVESISTIDPVKKVYREFFGWDGEKTPEHRKNLNVLKNIWRETSNGPINYINKLLVDLFSENTHIVFVMVREFEEMEQIKLLGNSLDFPSFTLAVDRPDIEIPPIEQDFILSHPKGYTYDFMANNPTTSFFPDCPQLRNESQRFWDSIVVPNVEELRIYRMHESPLSKKKEKPSKLSVSFLELKNKVREKYPERLSLSFADHTLVACMKELCKIMDNRFKEIESSLEKIKDDY